MDYTTPSKRPSYSNDPSPTKNTGKRDRARIACTNCRRLKERCLHDDDGTPCYRCCKRNIDCVYTPPSPSQRKPAPLPSNDPNPPESFARGVSIYQPLAPHIVTTADGQGRSNVAGYRTHAESLDITQARPIVVQQDHPYSNPEEGSGDNPPTQLGEFSQEMDAIYRENARKYPGMRRRGD